jgi:hypothetical protein
VLLSRDLADALWPSVLREGADANPRLRSAKRPAGRGGVCARVARVRRSSTATQSRRGSGLICGHRPALDPRPDPKGPPGPPRCRTGRTAYYVPSLTIPPRRGPCQESFAGRPHAHERKSSRKHSGRPSPDLGRCRLTQTRPGGRNRQTGRQAAAPSWPSQEPGDTPSPQAPTSTRRQVGQLWRMLLGCRTRGSGFLRSKVLVHHEPGTLSL